MALVLKDRVLESSTSTGTGSFTLTGAQTGYQSFSAIGNGNTTYYTIQGKNPDGTLTGEWEIGIGTWSTGNTLSRDTVLSNSLGTTAKIVFSAGAKDVFCDYPASKSVNQNADNKVIIPYTSGVTNTGSLNVGDVTAHTDSGVIAAFTASEPLYLYTSLQNTSSANTSYASYAVNDGGHTSYGELGINNSNYSYTAAGYPNNTFSAPLATFVESYGGPLAIGTWDSQKISFIVNGSVNTADAMTISAAGVVSLGTALGVTSGGTGLNSYTTGDILYSSATNTLSKLGIGSTGQVLTVAGGVPTWATGGSGLTINTTTISGGTSGRVLYDNAGTVGELVNTGTGNNVLSVAPSLTGAIVLGATNDTSIITLGQPTTSSQTINIANAVLASGNTQTINIGASGAAGSTTNVTIGSSTASGSTSIIGTVLIGGPANTGTITLGRSVNTQIVNIANGIIASGNTSTINMGTAGASGSTTAITIGGTANTSTTTINGALTATGALQLTGSDTVAQNIATSQTTGALNIGGTSATGLLTVGQSTGAQRIAIASGVNAGVQKRVDIANTGSNSGTRAINIARNIAAAAANSTTINIGDNNTAGTCYININSTFTQTTIALNTLITNVTPVTGMRAFINDYAIAPIFNADVTIAGGGGGFATPIWYDGTTWRVG